MSISYFWFTSSRVLPSYRFVLDQDPWESQGTILKIFVFFISHQGSPRIPLKWGRLIERPRSSLDALRAGHEILPGNPALPGGRFGFQVEAFLKSYLLFLNFCTNNEEQLSYGFFSFLELDNTLQLREQALERLNLGALPDAIPKTRSSAVVLYFIITDSRLETQGGGL